MYDMVYSIDITITHRRRNFGDSPRYSYIKGDESVCLIADTPNLRAAH